MGKIGEFEKTVVAEPLKEPLPAKKRLLKSPQKNLNLSRYRHNK